MIYPAHHKYFSSRSQSICGRGKFYSASNCPSVTSCLGYPPKGSVRLLLLRILDPKGRQLDRPVFFNVKKNYQNLTSTPLHSTPL